LIHPAESIFAKPAVGRGISIQQASESKPRPALEKRQERGKQNRLFTYGNGIIRP
jgi:hypothetical protein